MAFNMFIGRERAELEEALRAAQDELLNGRSTVSGSLAETSFQDAMTVGPAQRIKMIGEALNRIDPTSYPIGDTFIPTRTVATYSGGC